MDKLNEQISRMKTIMGLNESIHPDDSYGDWKSLKTVLDGKRSICTICEFDKDHLSITDTEHISWPQIMELLKKNNLLAMKIDGNPFNCHIVYRHYAHDQAKKLNEIAHKNGGYLKGTIEEEYEIGKLLEYHDDEIWKYLIKIFGQAEVNKFKTRKSNYDINEYSSPEQNLSAMAATPMVEAAKTVNDLPQDIALYHTTDKHDNGLILYSPMEKKIYAQISYEEIDPETVGLTSASAETGFGPLIHDMLLTFIYPKYLMQDRSGLVSDKEWNLWTQYTNNRTDVRKVILKPSDKRFSTAITHGSEAYLSPEEIESLERSQSIDMKKLKIYNTMLKGKLIKLKPYLNNAEKNPNQEITKLAARYFMDKYSNR